MKPAPHQLKMNIWVQPVGLEGAGLVYFLTFGWSQARCFPMSSLYADWAP